MHNVYVIERSSVDVLRAKHVLLDANFLIDALAFEKEAAELIARLRSLGCDLLTTRAVVVETLGGTRDRTILQKKVAYLEILFGRPLQIVSLPVERDLPTATELLKFSQQCNKFSNTDFELFLTLKRYKTSGILLVTRNHSDFTDKICDRQGFVTLLGNKEIRTYGIYQVR